MPLPSARRRGNFEACAVDPQRGLSDGLAPTSTTGWRSFRPTASARRCSRACASRRSRTGLAHDELITAVANYLGLPPVWAYEVATFYSMFHIGKVGRHNVSICTNISCWLRGAEELVRTRDASSGVKLGESPPTAASTWSPRKNAWPAAVRAPMMVIDGHYHENLDTAKVDQILDSLD
jgi:NADH-quinone oxidoreductase subunit E